MIKLYRRTAMLFGAAAVVLLLATKVDASEPSPFDKEAVLAAEFLCRTKRAVTLFETYDSCVSAVTDSPLKFRVDIIKMFNPGGAERLRTLLDDGYDIFEPLEPQQAARE